MSQPLSASLPTGLYGGTTYVFGAYDAGTGYYSYPSQSNMRASR